MSPIITLLTDFGQSDSYVAEMKAVLLGSAPGALLVDVVHDVPPGDIRAAQYLFARSWHRFPEGSVHLVVVDPGVGTSRRALAAARDRHLFVGPDNGVLTPILSQAEVVALEVPPDASPTFHGRDLFAPAAARLARGDGLRALGRPVGDLHLTPLPAPRREGHTVVGEVIYVDRFGTLVSNIDRQLAGDAATASVPGGHSAPVARTFGDVEPGALVAFVGSGGMVEIAARGRSAAEATGARVGTEVRVVLRG